MLSTNLKIQHYGTVVKPECLYASECLVLNYKEPTLNSFNKHVQDKAAAATKAIYRISNIRRLSLATALILFNTAISPIVTYGIDLIWEKLTISDLRRIENIKALFIKTALAIRKTAPSRLAHELAKETCFIENLRIKLLLSSTAPYNKLLQERKEKRSQIDAKIDQKWIRRRLPRGEHGPPV